MTHLAITLVLLSAFLHALKSLLIKTSSDKQIFLWWYSVCGLAVYLPGFLFFLQRESLELSQLFPWCFLSGVIHFFYALIIITFTFEKVSYVAAFRQLSIVFAVLMGHGILKEENRVIRTAASAIIFVGAFLIATA